MRCLSLLASRPYCMLGVGILNIFMVPYWFASDESKDARDGNKNKIRRSREMCEDREKEKLLITI